MSQQCYTVMLVEDSITAAKKIAGWLRELETKEIRFDVVSQARSLLQALAHYQTCQPDLVSLDIQLIGSLDGIRVLQYLRTMNPAVRAVFFTFRTELIGEMIAQGGRGLIDKGIINGPLTGTIRDDIRGVLQYVATGSLPPPSGRNRHPWRIDAGFVSLFSERRRL